MYRALSRRLVEIAFRLQQSGDELDAEAAAWILTQEKEARHSQAARVPYLVQPRPGGGHVKVHLRCGAVGWVPAHLVQEALDSETLE